MCFRAPLGLEGSRSPLRSGRCKTNIHRMFCNVSRSNKQEGTCGYYFCISNPAGLEGSRSPLCSGRCETNVHRTFRNVSRSKRNTKRWYPIGYHLFCVFEPRRDSKVRGLRFGRCKANIHRMFCSLRSASVVAKRTSTGRSATSRALKETRKNSENTQRILRVFVTRTKISQRKTKCFAY